MLVISLLTMSLLSACDGGDEPTEQLTSQPNSDPVTFYEMFNIIADAVETVSPQNFDSQALCDTA